MALMWSVASTVGGIRTACRTQLSWPAGLGMGIIPDPISMGARSVVSEGRYDAHPKRAPLYAEIHSVINLERFDIQAERPSGGPTKDWICQADTRATRQARPQPGCMP